MGFQKPKPEQNLIVIVYMHPFLGLILLLSRKIVLVYMVISSWIYINVGRLYIFPKNIGLSPYSLISHKNWPNACFYIIKYAKSALLPAILWWTGILLIKIEFLLIQLYLRNFITQCLLICSFFITNVTKETW